MSKILEFKTNLYNEAKEIKEKFELALFYGTVLIVVKMFFSKSQVSFNQLLAFFEKSLLGELISMFALCLILMGVILMISFILKLISLPWNYKKIGSKEEFNWLYKLAQLLAEHIEVFVILSMLIFYIYV